MKTDGELATEEQMLSVTLDLIEEAQIRNYRIGPYRGPWRYYPSLEELTKKCGARGCRTLTEFLAKREAVTYLQLAEELGVAAMWIQIRQMTEAVNGGVT